MRITLLIFACLASLAGGVPLFAQDDESYGDAPELVVSQSGSGDEYGSDEVAGDDSQCAPVGVDSQCGPTCDAPQYYPGGPNPNSGPRHPHAAGMAYYTRRAAQKADTAVYDALSAATHPCSTLHTIVENDIERKLKHCKCLGKFYGNRIAATRAATTPWHGDYYYPQWGAPVALIVPPTCEYQTNYSWGVPAHRIEPIDHQFSRSAAGAGFSSWGSTGFMPPPYYPDDTNQFGVYYVRGPW